MPAFKLVGATLTGAGRQAFDENLALAFGQHTTVAASDTVVTGLSRVLQVTATLQDDPTDTASLAAATIGDQAGTPAAGSVLIKTWKPTTGGASGNPTLVAATAFSKKVNWIAVGLP
jgi:hypothetical protein